MNTKRTSLLAITALSSAMIGSVAFADNAAVKTNINADTNLTTGKTLAQDTDASVETKLGTKADAALKDDAYVTLSGTVGKFSDGDEFELKYSGGTIMVDANDDTSDMFSGKEASDVLRTGTTVTVTGTVDEDLFSKKEIDATQIRADGKVYNDADYNEKAEMDDDADKMVDGKQVRLSGNVSRMVDSDEFVLNYSGGDILVDASDVKNSTDKLTVGDRVSVYGEIDDKWYTRKHFEAKTIAITKHKTPRS